MGLFFVHGESKMLQDYSDGSPGNMELDLVPRFKLGYALEKHPYGDYNLKYEIRSTKRGE